MDVLYVMKLPNKTEQQNNVILCFHCGCTMIIHTEALAVQVTAKATAIYNCKLKVLLSLLFMFCAGDYSGLCIFSGV